MERIRLTKEEKITLRSVLANGEKQPRNLTPLAFHFALSTLANKGLIDFMAQGDDVLNAELTIMGRAYIEANPGLANPVPWKEIVLVTLTAITALSTFFALFK